MSGKRKTAIVALLSVFAATTAFAACETSKNITEVPTDKDYGYQDPDRMYAKPDEGFRIDGKADEEAYKNCTWVTLNNKNGTNTVDFAMTSYFGEEGMYFVYDVTENTPIYVNHDRASYINSGIEMYFAPQGVSTMKNDHVYEIDIQADGEVNFKKTAGFGGQWTNVGTTSDIMAYAASNPKGGEINSGDCYGYTLEFFIPWKYAEWLGMNPETMKEETVSVNPAHITSYNYNGTQHQIDRYWYSFATQLGGDGWDNVDRYFKLGKNGVVGTVPVTYGEGEHCTVTGAKAVLPGLPLTVTVTPEEGYAVGSLTCGGECAKFLNYNKDGSATYTVVGSDDGMAFAAAAEQVVAGNKNLTGKINLKKAGGDTTDGLSASYFDASGEHLLPLNADGTFALNDLPQGYYEISAEKDGYGKATRGIYLNRDIDTQIDLEFGAFEVEEGSCWDISYANEGYLIKKGGRGAILSKHSYGTFYAEAYFRYDAALAAQSSADDYYQQRTGFRIKFAGGKYWHPDLMCEGGEYKLTYGKIKGNDSIFNWDTAHVMNAKQIAKYKSEEGIKLAILRDGTTAYLYLDDELVAQTDLGAQGIKADETAKIGFEGFAMNSQSWRIDYRFRSEGVKEVTVNTVKAQGATVSVEATETPVIGGDVTLVFSKEVDTHVLLSLLVNGEEMSGSVKEGASGSDVLTILNNMSRTLNVEVIYGAPQEITANIAVDAAWNANGIEFKFKNAANPELTKTAMVSGNKMQIANMLQGRWLVTANVFGKNIDLGSYSVVSEAEKKLDVENVFIGGKNLDPSVIDLSKGNFVYHSAIDEDYSIRIDEAGDAFLAAKIKLGAEDKAKFLKGGEVSFGMYMTVADGSGKESTHWVDFWLKNAGGENWFSLRTDFGWAEDVCRPFTTQIDTNQYSKALFGNGLYVVLRYKAEAGVMETYLGVNDYEVKYLRDWNDSAHLFPANGTVTKAGFRDNLTWGGTSVTVQAEGFRYGKTLLAALGVEGKNVVLEKDLTGGSVDLSGTPKAGEDVTLTVTPDSGKILSSLIINGADMTELVTAEGVLVIKNCTAATLNVEAVFEAIRYAETLEIVLNGRKHGVSDNVAEGKAVTLTRGELSYAGTVTEGKVTFKNVVLADRYTLTVEGFVPQTGLTVTGSGIEGVTGAIDMEYDMFYARSNYGNPSKIDKSHVNDGNAYFIANDGANDFYQYTNDQYNKVSVSLTANAKMATYNPTIGLVFEGNKAVMLRIEKQDNGAKYKVQWIGGGNWEESGINGNEWDFGNGEEFYNPISSTLKSKYENVEQGLTITLVRNGGIVCAYLDGVFLGFQTIPNYAGKTCRAMFAIAGIKGGTKVPFSITENIPSVTIADETAADANGTVTVAETAKIGQEITLSLNPIADYKVETLTVNGVDVTKNIVNDQYKFIATSNAVVKATFAPIVKVDFDLSVVGNKLGVEGNALNGDEVTLSDGAHVYTGQVTDGTVSFTQVITGKNYMLSATGFISKTDLEVLPETGIEDTVTLVFDTMFNMAKSWNWSDGGVISGEYGEKYKHVSGATLWYATNESYNKVIISANVNTDATGRQGVMIKFGNDYVMSQLETLNGGSSYKISWNNEGNYSVWGTGVNNVTGTWDAFIDPLSSEQVAAMKKGEVFITLLRDGNTIHGFVNDVYYSSITIDEKYQKATCQVGFYATDIKPNAEREYYVTANISDATVSIPTFANGTVTSEQTGGKVGDELTLTVTPEAGYACTSLKVNGRELLTNSVTSATIIKTVMSAQSVIEATFVQTFVTSVDLITDNNANIDLDADVNGMKVLGYEMFDGENSVYAKDENNLLDIGAAKDHKNGYAGDFNSHGWTVVSDNKNGGALCITGEFDMQVKIVKGTQAIRIFVGGWWMGNHGGVFSFRDSEGNVYATYTYRSAGGMDPNDIIVFNVDTSSWAEGESRELVLHFNGNGFNQLPFAGVQILGEAADASAE